METRLAGELGVERRGDDIALADGHDAAVIETCQDVDVRPRPIDDRRADEDRMDGRVTQDRDVELRLERVELTPERVALDGDVNQREDRRLAACDLAREDDHPGTGPEDRSAARGEIEDRLAGGPAGGALTRCRGS